MTDPTLHTQKLDQGDSATSPEPGSNQYQQADTIQPDAANQIPVSPIARPAEIAGYEIQGELGRGGMGVVYRAKQKGLNRIVALKMILHADHAGSEDRERFQREAEAIARLDHPNIVRIFEISEHEGKPFFSLEYLEGGSLLDKLDGTPMKANRAALLVEKLARAMHVAHQAGVVHRDLKPANVLLTVDGEPRVTDFGLAKNLEEDGKTQSGAILGTPSYMAPEQAEGKTKEMGPAVDVYALGAILYECLHGRPPFKAATAMDTVWQVISQPPISLRQLNPEVSKDLDTICMKCLRKEAKKRYASSLELAEDLRRNLNHEPIHARPQGRIEKTIKWIKRRPALAAFWLVLFLAVVGFLTGGVLFTMKLNRERLRAEEGERNANIEKANAIQKEAEAQKARKEADMNFAHARRAVDRFFTEVSENTLLLEPGMKPLRRKLLAESRKFYSDFVQQHSDDPDLWLELGKTEARLGDILAEIDTYEKGIEHYRRSIEILNKLPANRRSQNEVIAELAHDHYHLGRLLRRLQQPDSAKQELEKSIVYWKQLRKAQPENHRYYAELARTQMGLGNVYNLTRRPKKALEFYLESLKAREELTKLESENPEHQRDLATNLDNIAMIHASQKQLPAAIKSNQRAVQILRELTTKYPRRDRYWNDLGRNRYNRGNYLARSSQYADAERAYHEAAGIWMSLIQKHPKVYEYQSTLSSAFRNWSLTLSLQKKFTQADDLYRRWETFTQNLVQQYPTYPEFQINLATLYRDLGNRLRKRKKFKEAADNFEKAIPLLEKLHQSYPRILQYEVELANVWNDRGLLARAMGQREQAEQAHLKALSILEHDLATMNEEKTTIHAIVKINLADFYRIKGQLAETVKCCDQAQEELSHLLSLNYQTNLTRKHLRDAHSAKAKALTQMRQSALSLQEWEKAKQLTKSRSMLFWITLYRLSALAQTSQYGEAIQEAETLPIGDKAASDAHYELAAIYACACQSVGHRKDLTPEQIKAEKEKLKKQATQQLERAKKKGWFQRQFNRQVIQSDVRFIDVISVKDYLQP